AGDLCVSGSKNAALPEMAAALLTEEPVHLKNVPRVTDTHVMAQVLASIGAKCNGEGAITIDARGASAPRVPDDLGKRMRATILLLGALLGRRSRSEEHTSELQSRGHLVCRLLLEKKRE